MGEEYCDKANSSSGGGGFQLSDKDLEKIINALGSRCAFNEGNKPSLAGQDIKF